MHTKYKSPITYHSKDMATVKVFKKGVKLQGQGQKIMVPLENPCHKEHTDEIFMKALSLTIQKRWPMLKFMKRGSNVKVKVTRSKILVPIDGSCHKEHAYEI
jgi:hypothetical protein